MADIHGFNHSGLSVPNVREGEQFYERVLGGRHCNRTSLSGDSIRGGHGAAHTCNIVGDYLFVLFPHQRLIPESESPRGIDGGRHAFSVSHARFSEIVENVREEGIPFEGPVEHPERGPLGESIYLTDTGGNFFEICWRRDEDVAYDPMMAKPAAVDAPMPRSERMEHIGKR